MIIVFCLLITFLFQNIKHVFAGRGIVYNQLLHELTQHE